MSDIGTVKSTSKTDHHAVLLSPAEKPRLLRGELQKQPTKVRSCQMGFVRAARKDEIAPGSIREFQVDGLTVAIANVGNKFYAINNTCLHRGGPLAQGVLQGVAVTCPWHGWQYDVTTGKLTMNPVVAVKTYALEVRGEDLWIEAS
jgi:nitrite reductase/ring-hydroxylating ferredoxin subunit